MVEQTSYGQGKGTVCMSICQSVCMYVSLPVCLYVSLYYGVKPTRKTSSNQTWQYSVIRIA